MGDSGEDSLQRFERLSLSFEEAWRRNPHACRSWDIVLAAAPTRLRVVGKTLAAYVEGPLAHLRAADSKRTPQLMIDLWDEHVAGVDGPPASERHATGKVWPMIEQRMAASSDGRFVSEEVRGCVTWLDRRAQRLVGLVPDAERLSLHRRGKPLQNLLGFWLADRGLFSVHAALVAQQRRAVLAPGNGGAGKSTTALSCLLAGLDYLGDDWAAVSLSAEGSFIGYALYNSAFVEPDHLQRFPLLQPHAQAASDASETKSLLLLRSLFPERLVESAMIAAIALPQVGSGKATRLRRASKGEALRQILPSTIVALRPRAGRRQVEQLAEMVDQLPVWWIEIGTDLTDIPRRIAEILAT